MAGKAISRWGCADDYEEKQHWLQVFARHGTRSLVDQQRKVRDDAAARQYEPASGLQTRLWKLALIDAAETWDKYWQTPLVETRRKIGRRRDFDESMRNYSLLWLRGCKNRNGDRFVCPHCGHKEPSDRIAATNILSRLGDCEITRYAPYRDVKSIRFQRFHRRLETEGGLTPAVTVPGRTSETDPTTPPSPAKRKLQRGGRKADHPTVNRRAKQSKNGVAGNGDHV